MIELAELLERCRAGDELAWEMFVRTYQSRICAIAYAYVGNPEDARDLAQTIFIRLYQKLDRCRDAERFPAWMNRLARNASIDFLRRRGARPPAQDLAAEEMRDLASSEPTPEEQWVTEKRKQLVYRAMQSLSRFSREIILLKEIQGLTMEEISETLEIPLGTVKSRSNRARLDLARALLMLEGGSEAVVH